MRIETEVSIEKFLEEMESHCCSKYEGNIITQFCKRWLKNSCEGYIPENLKEEELLTAFIDATNKYSYDVLLDKLK